jgi:excinuclease ABC subunit C
MPARRKFAYPPNLAVIDGGPAQVAAAADALEELGVVEVSVCGLAKRLEEVWLPGEDSPVILPRSSEGLYLLQRVRDEAHRFAITYHRAKRAAALTASELDGIPGLGRARKAALLRHFGSVRRLRDASAEQIAVLPGIGPRIAAAVAAALHQPAQREPTEQPLAEEQGKQPVPGQAEQHAQTPQQPLPHQPEAGGESGHRRAVSSAGSVTGAGRDEG